MRNKLSPREEKVLLTMQDYFLNGGAMSLPEMVVRYWGVDPMKDKDDYPFYEKRQRYLVGRLKNKLFEMDPRETPLRKYNLEKLWLMTVDPDPNYNCRRYKVMTTPIDSEKVSRLSMSRITGLIYNHEDRMGQAMRQFPDAFGNRIRLSKQNLHYLEPEEKNER